ncbi:hypothetical protein Q8A73_011498 [Channa argus]|nr:hypothetical protein Q8A73_011498 [Channa argus]
MRAGSVPKPWKSACVSSQAKEAGAVDNPALQSCSTPSTTEQSQHQSKLSCFNLLNRSCEDPACLTEPTVSFNRNLCPSGQRGSVRAAVGGVMAANHRHLLLRGASIVSTQDKLVDE